MTTKGTSKTGSISRRTFLKTTAGTAALLGAAQTQFPFGAHIAAGAGPGGEEGDPRLHRADGRRRRW